VEQPPFGPRRRSRPGAGSPAAVGAPVPTGGSRPATWKPPAGYRADRRLPRRAGHGVRKVIAGALSQSFHGSVPCYSPPESPWSAPTTCWASSEADFRAKTAEGGLSALIVKAARNYAARPSPTDAHWMGHAIRLSRDRLGIRFLGRRADRAGAATRRPLEPRRDRDAVAALAERHGRGVAVRGGWGSHSASRTRADTHRVLHAGDQPTQVAILGVGRAVQKPAIRDGQVRALPVLREPRFDHRAVDGQPAPPSWMPSSGSGRALSLAGVTTTARRPMGGPIRVFVQARPAAQGYFVGIARRTAMCKRCCPRTDERSDVERHLLHCGEDIVKQGGFSGSTRASLGSSRRGH